MKDINESLYKKYDFTIDAAYIITLSGNPVSEQFTKRCISSCESVNQPYKLWQGFNGSSGNIITPEQHQNKSYLNWLKIYNIKLSPTQIGCFLSHYSLWVHCIELDKPIIILEHDAVMVNNYPEHRLYNSIVYLGSYEQSIGAPIFSIPPHASDHNGNVRSICRAHAYAIDPAVAKNLVSYTIKQGITESLDMFMRADLFPIAQFPDLYAYDLNPDNNSTIHKEW